MPSNENVISYAFGINIFIYGKLSQWHCNSRSCEFLWISRSRSWNGTTIWQTKETQKLHGDVFSLWFKETILTQIWLAYFRGSNRWTFWVFRNTKEKCIRHISGAMLCTWQIISSVTLFLMMLAVSTQGISFSHCPHIFRERIHGKKSIVRGISPCSTLSLTSCQRWMKCWHLLLCWLL